MESLFAVKISWLIPLLPLIGAAVAGFAGARWLKQNSHWPIWIGVGLSAILSFALLFGMIGHWPDEGETGATGLHGAGSSAVIESRPGVHRNFPLALNHHWYSWISAGDFQVSA